MICSKEKCTGCSACYNICPKNAIIMQKDEYGNIYPLVNESKCIKCGLCKKVCPSINNNITFNMPFKTYALYNKNSKERSQSASGGAASLLYESFLAKGGKIYGASNLFGKDEFEFIRIDNKDDLYKVKGSKYVHCYINNIFKDVKNDLEEKELVLFIGTPCQISGLKNFLLKDYNNLLTVDIICHGVPSQQLLFDEIKEKGFNNRDISLVTFRDNKMFNFKIFDNKNINVFEKEYSQVDYYRNFLEGNFYRENCYNCSYAQRKRISDLTIGDFWGLDKSSKVYDDERKGISVVLVNTEKGYNALNEIFNKCVYEERSIEEACRINGQLNKPMKKNKKYKLYLKYYPKKGYKYTMNKMLTYKQKIKRLLIKNKSIYNFIKKIK